MTRATRPVRHSRREGTILVLSAFMLVFFLDVAALSLDLGYMLYVRAQAQRCADAAALAGAWAMTGQSRITGQRDQLYQSARTAAVEYAGRNGVNGRAG